MKRIRFKDLRVSASALAAFASFCAPTSRAAHTISGTVLEGPSGVSDVTVLLCDQKSGLPVSADTFLTFTNDLSFPPKLATTQSQKRGGFVFNDVPAGEYRLVAQRWLGPFKGVFELHGSVIQLFGSADSVRVPSAAADKIVLKPPGTGVLALDLETPNNGTLMLLSMQPMLADPVLGFHALGTNYLSHAIGVNVMPYGRTTIVGVPRGTVHAWFFANDNSPGFATETYDMSKSFFEAPRIPFVAGWSDGRHEPPLRLKSLNERLKKQGLTAGELLGIDSGLSAAKKSELVRKSYNDLSAVVMLPDGEQAKKADLVAIVLYELMQANRARRQ